MSCTRRCLFLVLLAAAFVLPMNTVPAAAQTRAPDGEFPASWFYADRKTGGRRAGPMKIEGKPAPKLVLKEWIGKETSLEKLKGKVVVIDYWATWCRPCMASIPKNNKLYKEWQPRGLEMIGVHNAGRGWDKAAGVVKSKKILYPVALDTRQTKGRAGVSSTAWNVSFWPTYVVIDHRGIVRASGLVPNKVESVVKILIEEMEAENAATEGK